MAAPPYGGATYTVTNLDDGGPGSLRKEIATAQSGAMISFTVGGTIVLTNGELLISNSLRIVGPGATNLAISAGGESRVLEILSNATVTVSGLTICNGHAADGAAGTSNSPVGGNGSDGGGIYNAGSLNLAQCIISNCAAGNGGAGYQVRDETVLDATNWIGGAGGRGGAVYNAGALSLTGCTVISNSSGGGGNGGGAYTNGAWGSSGGGGGGIYNAGTMAFASCSFEGNAAGNGGAAYSYNSFETVPEYAGGEHGGAGGNGGAVCDAGQTRTVMSDCQFSFNGSGTGGIGTSTDFSFPDFGGPGGAGGDGGAVWAGGSIGLTQGTFLFNRTGAGGAGGFGMNQAGAGGAGGSGGALWAGGSAGMYNCTLLSNFTAAGGTGAYGAQIGGGGGDGGSGGAICSLGELSLQECSFSSNYTGAGGEGGIGYDGTFSLVRTSGGWGGSGGGGGAVYAASALRLNECTFGGNWAGAGGEGASSPSSISYYPTPGGGGTAGSGGALCCQANLAATNCTFNNNKAGNGGIPGTPGFNSGFDFQPSSSGSDGGQGGAILGAGALVLHGCTVSGNAGGNATSARPGSGPLVATNRYLATLTSGGTLDATAGPDIIIYTWIGKPGGAGGTGGIYSESNMKMVLCTVSGNIGGAGGWGGDSSGGYMEYLQGGPGGNGGPGAVCCLSSNDFTACTIAGNVGGSAGTGGQGVPVPDFSGRTGQGPGGAGGAGGIYDTNAAVSASVINTIVASNFGANGAPGGPYRGSSGADGAPDVEGLFISSGYNLIGEGDGSSGFTNGVNGDLVGSISAPIDPLLGPLADNGGPTFTMALLHGSPALNAGDNRLLAPPYLLHTDQRGFPRKSGPRVDIGAFEYQYGNRGANPPGHQMTLSGSLSANGSLQSNAVGANSGIGAAAPCFQLTFGDSTPGASFSVLATTNLSLPAENWSVIGQPVQVSPGVFQFTDVDSTNQLQRFYRVSSP